MTEQIPSLTVRFARASNPGGTTAMGVRDLLDRQAAEMVRCRIDLTYATVVALDDPGFHHGVPADTRDRPAEGHRVDRILDLALGPASSKPDRYANAPRTGLELGGVT